MRKLFLFGLVSGGALSAATLMAAGESIVRDGAFERERPVEFHCANDGGPGGRFEIHTEDLSWNRCGRLIVGRKHQEPANGKTVDVYSATVRIGGEGRSPERFDALRERCRELLLSCQQD